MGIPVDARMDSEGVMKGLNRSVNKLGPGQYEHRIGSRSREGSAPSYTVPTALETPEALRARKKLAQSPGPGNYNITRYGDEMGKEKQKAMERAVRRSGRSCWAESQYSHIFACMKPRGSGLLPAVGSSLTESSGSLPVSASRTSPPSSPAA